MLTIVCAQRFSCQPTSFELRWGRKAGGEGRGASQAWQGMESGTAPYWALPMPPKGTTDTQCHPGSSLSHSSHLHTPAGNRAKNMHAPHLAGCYSNQARVTEQAGGECRVGRAEDTSTPAGMV